MISRRWLKGRLFIFAGLAALTAIVGSYWLLVRDRHVRSAPNVSCRVRFLEPAERSQIAADLLATGAIDQAFPAELSANPVVHHGRYATVRFENTTDVPLNLYSLCPWPLSADMQEANRALATELRNATGDTFRTPRQKEELVRSLEAPIAPTLRSAFVVDEELRAPNGTSIARTDLSHPAAWLNQSVPPASELLARNPLRFILLPGEGIDLPVSVLGNLRNRANGLTPGTYTLRVTVSYAEAPSAEVRHITSEPVTITVTEEHIKAAEAYWASVQK